LETAVTKEVNLLPAENNSAEAVSVAAADDDDYLKPENWKVAKYVGHRKATKKKGEWELLSRWFGYEEADDTWEAIKKERIINAKLVTEYCSNYPDVFLECRKVV
jgi:hypothetical protein